MKCLRELTEYLTPSQFPQDFLTNPAKLRIYLGKIPTVRNFDSVNQLYWTCPLMNLW